VSEAPREQWASRAGFVLATLGCAVGLGNIWRFAYVAGENGGAAFLLAYVACVVAIGLPAMLAEFVLGSRARLDVVGAFSSSKAPRAWRLAGIGAVLGAFLILSYYSVVAGWAYKYFAGYATGDLRGLPRGEAAARFTAFLREPAEPMAWHFVFMATTVTVVALGVARGIERASRILMPLLGAIVLLLAGYALSLPGAARGLAFLFAPDWSALTRPGLYLAALGQAFFSLGVGMGVLVTYASYVREGERLPRAAGMIAAGDTLFAIAAGVAIFPAVFAFGIDPAAEEGLVFITLPNIFQQIPGGYFFSLIFFVLLTVAALTSTISVLEVVVTYFVEELKMTRKRATALAAVSISVLGFFAAASWGWFRNTTIFGMNVFGLLNFTSANILLPLGGFFIVVFTGWFMGRRKVKAELSNGGSLRARFWPVFLFLVRFIAPIAIALVFLNGIGIIRF